MVGRGRRERGWRAGRRSPQIRARSREELPWKGGKAKRKGRRREGGAIRPPPWLRAWCARIRPPPARPRRTRLAAADAERRALLENQAATAESRWAEQHATHDAG